MCLPRRINPVDILLVEDNATDAQLIREAIRKGTISTRVVVLDNGKEADAYLSKTGQYSDAANPALILLDLVLPEKTGIELLEKIRSSETSLRLTPVIIISRQEDIKFIWEAYD